MAILNRHMGTKIQDCGKTIGFLKVKIEAGSIPFYNMEKVHGYGFLKLLGN